MKNIRKRSPKAAFFVLGDIDNILPKNQYAVCLINKNKCKLHL